MYIDRIPSHQSLRVIFFLKPSGQETKSRVIGKKWTYRFHICKLYVCIRGGTLFVHFVHYVHFVHKNLSISPTPPLGRNLKFLNKKTISKIWQTIVGKKFVLERNFK